MSFERLVRFGIVGVLNSGVDYGVFLLLFRLGGLPLLVANSIAVLVAASHSYVWNKFWTFRDLARGRTAWERYALFLMFNLGGLVLGNLVLLALAQLMAPELAKLGSIAIIPLWNFWTSQRFVYRH